MKNLANCKPSEFLVQTNRIRKAVEKWLTDTDIMNIRKNVPQFDLIDPSLPADERQKIFDENRRKANEQAKKNLSNILDAILEAHADETLELLALLCFIEPEQADDYPVSDYLSAVSELISNRAVLDFFTSLAQLAQTDISPISKA